MKNIRSLTIFLIVLFPNLIFANGLTAPSINLGNIVVNHIPGTSNLKWLSLLPLARYTPVGYWHISCNYNIKETGGALPPSSKDPFFARIQNMGIVNISGEGFSENGFTASNGTLHIQVVLSSYSSRDIDIYNFDTTGDLTLSNCVGTLQIT